MTLRVANASLPANRQKSQPYGGGLTDYAFYLAHKVSIAISLVGFWGFGVLGFWGGGPGLPK